MCTVCVQDVRWLVNGAPSKISNQYRFNRYIEGYLKPGAIRSWIKNVRVFQVNFTLTTSLVVSLLSLAKTAWFLNFFLAAICHLSAFPLFPLTKIDCEFQTIYLQFSPIRELSTCLHAYVQMCVSIRNSILDSEDTSRFRFYGNTRYQVKRSVDNVICIYTAEIQACTRKKKKHTRGAANMGIEFLLGIFGKPSSRKCEVQKIINRALFAHLTDTNPTLKISLK